MSPSGSNFKEMAYDINLIELNEVLRRLKGSTPAIDKITYAMIKNSPPEVKIRLCNLYNLILKSGIYPHQWKTAMLTPIPKPK